MPLAPAETTPEEGCPALFVARCHLGEGKQSYAPRNMAHSWARKTMVSQRKDQKSSKGRKKGPSGAKEKPGGTFRQDGIGKRMRVWGVPIAPCQRKRGTLRLLGGGKDDLGKSYYYSPGEKKEKNQLTLSGPEKSPISDRRLARGKEGTQVRVEKGGSRTFLYKRGAAEGSPVSHSSQGGRRKARSEFAGKKEKKRRLCKTERENGERPKADFATIYEERRSTWCILGWKGEKRKKQPGGGGT